MQIVLSWFTVENLEAAKKFYNETLGLKQIFEMPGWAEFGGEIEGLGIGLAEKPGVKTNGDGGVVVLKVDDLETTRRKLIDSGVEFEDEIEEFPGIVKLAGFRDPFGNRLQLMQQIL